MRELACSDDMRRYFQNLFRENDHCYAVATKAREMGYDPQTYVEIPQAEDLAARVEEQLSQWEVDGVADLIRDLSSKHDSREEVSLLVAKEVAKWPAKSNEEAIDRAVRVGLSVLTEGILVAPIVGIGGVKIGTNTDGSQYVSLFFNGPIRSAGGTGQAMSVLIADMVRREFGLGVYKPEHGEVERLKEEIPLYKQCQHLQYVPGNEEIELIYKNCPVCIDGEKTEDLEISGFRNLPRIKTNNVRGGVCLVISEGMCLKAPKLKKHVDKLGIDGWGFLGEYINRKKNKGDSKDSGKVAPDSKYLKDIVGGRPVLGHPSRAGGLRLRYGRGRTTGLAALALNPATMFALDSFLAIGTQIKIERPGKAGAVTPCDELEGPILLLKNGDLVQANTVEEVKRYRHEMKQIVDLGEVLLPFGEFVENNHVLVQGDYAIEWYKQELLPACDHQLPDDWRDPKNLERAIELSKQFKVPLHPNFNLFWYDLKLESLQRLRSRILENGSYDGCLTFTPTPEEKLDLENLGALHTMADQAVKVDRYALPLLKGLGLGVDGGRIVEIAPLQGSSVMAAVSAAYGITVRPRAVTRIGSRMARPEKAKERKMKPPPHVLFPIGKNGGPQRLLDKAAENKSISVEVGVRTCPDCGDSSTISCRCPECGAHTTVRDEPQEIGLNLKDMIREAAENLREGRIPDKIKCVEGLISKDKTPEPLEKGILRRKHDIFVNKDGTIRFDLTDVPLTHFRPREIGLSVEKAIQLGYQRDIHDEPLTSPEQICELRVQDIVPSVSCGDFMVQVAKFTDDLLTKFYKMEPFYNAKERSDLIGHLTIGLAPHTSGGILCRIIGYSDSAVCYGHPFFHAAKRRNADGDEDSVMLLMDGLLNFSRAYLPDSRGGLMDAPLVLAIRLDPNEIDKEAHNIDLLWEYPLEFYKATMEMKQPKEVQGQMDLVADRVKSLLQYEGFGFTHDTHNISEGPKESSYKTLGSMADKMKAQLNLARMIRAVDEVDTAQRIISKHFLPDLIGNLKQFSGQKMRCTKCGASYRRVPLSGKCYCGNKLNLTVYEASVKKYLAVTKKVGKEYGVSMYIQQRVGIIEDSIRSIFGNADTALDIDLDSLDEPIMEEEEAPKARTLDFFTASCIDAPEEDPLPGPEDDPELLTTVRDEPRDEVPLQVPEPKRKACSLDDYF
ncbi:MAG: DNA polymerase II large subunit [Methanomassiliicoccales archaeon PtaU1.Bin124]|nr:MAG: DNA polymerase II large subunit [Methanomassiliicoccales archaeon PtaU1.Bin124]